MLEKGVIHNVPAEHYDERTPLVHRHCEKILHSVGERTLSNNVAWHGALPMHVERGSMNITGVDVRLRLNSALKETILLP